MTPSIRRRSSSSQFRPTQPEPSAGAAAPVETKPLEDTPRNRCLEFIKHFAKATGDGLGRTGLEPVTSCVSSSETPVVTVENMPLTTPPNNARTGACTSNAKLAVLADLLADLPGPQRRQVIASLPLADRVAIARLLVLQQTSPLSWR